MISYKDKSFCSVAPICANRKTCGRWFSPEEARRAAQWWETFKNPDEAPPVAYSDFRDTCPAWEST